MHIYLYLNYYYYHYYENFSFFLSFFFILNYLSLPYSGFTSQNGYPFIEQSNDLSKF